MMKKRTGRERERRSGTKKKVGRRKGKEEKEGGEGGQYSVAHQNRSGALRGPFSL